MQAVDVDRGFEGRYVAPNELHHWWDLVIPGIDECRNLDRDDVWREDVYAAIKYGAVELHVFLWDGLYEGLMIFSIQTDPHDASGRYMHVWYGHRSEQNKDHMALTVQYLKDVARQRGCQKVLLQGRLGFMRWGREFGLSPRSVCAECEL